MSDDLVKRHIEQLRLTGGDLADLCQPLADAIEALTAEREASEQDNYRWKMECENFWRDREKTLTAERDDALECNEQFFVYNQFLKKRAEAAEAERDRLRAAIMFWLAAQEPDVDAAIDMMRAALKGESYE